MTKPKGLLGQVLQNQNTINTVLNKDDDATGNEFIQPYGQMMRDKQPELNLNELSSAESFEIAFWYRASGSGASKEASSVDRGF